MSERASICELDNHLIKDYYNETCLRWEFWHPTMKIRKDDLFGKVCKSCKHHKLEGSE